jgi:hypothetical protein
MKSIFVILMASLNVAVASESANSLRICRAENLQYSTPIQRAKLVSWVVTGYRPIETTGYQSFARENLIIFDESGDVELKDVCSLSDQQISQLGIAACRGNSNLQTLMFNRLRTLNALDPREMPKI